MTLRARLVLVLGSLVALLLAAEWSLVRALTRDLDQEVDVVALTVGSSMLHLLAGPEGERIEVTEAPGGRPDGSRPQPPRAVEAPGAPQFELHEVVETRWVAGSEPSFERSFERVRRGAAGDTGLDLDGDLQVFVFRSDEGDAPSAREARSALTTEALQRRLIAHSGPDGLAPLHLLEDLPGAAPERTRSARFELRIGSHKTAVSLAPTVLPGVEIAEHRLVEVIGSGSELQAGRPLSAASAPMRIPVPRSGLDRAVDGFLSKLLLGSIALLVVGLGAIAWVAHRVTRPLRGLADAAQRVGRGELGVHVAEDGDREVAATLRAFNGMSQRLAELDEETRRLRDREHLGELGDVARGLAHALRNPLHTLGLAVDALANAGDTERADLHATARAARTQIERIDGALEGFLTLAGAGGTRERVALDDLARDVALELAQSTHPTAVRVLAEGGPVRVACVPAELRAVVHALVVNAAEAAVDEPVVVRVEALQDGARARLEVLDRGAGVAPAVRAKLFTPHVTTKAHGTGMGLYLAERIARTRYGGSLALIDRPGGGTRAVLEIATLAAPGDGDGDTGGTLGGHRNGLGGRA